MDIYCCSLFIISAGIDTSRYTLRFALLHMMAFPDIQAKVQDELDQVVGMSLIKPMQTFK